MERVALLCRLDFDRVAEWLDGGEPGARVTPPGGDGQPAARMAQGRRGAKGEGREADPQVTEAGEVQEPEHSEK